MEKKIKYYFNPSHQVYIKIYKSDPCQKTASVNEVRPGIIQHVYLNKRC